jgi:hypothetical protein
MALPAMSLVNGTARSARTLLKVLDLRVRREFSCGVPDKQGVSQFRAFTRSLDQKNGFWEEHRMSMDLYVFVDHSPPLTVLEWQQAIDASHLPLRLD